MAGNVGNRTCPVSVVSTGRALRLLGRVFVAGITTHTGAVVNHDKWVLKMKNKNEFRPVKRRMLYFLAVARR